jgi:hypothetical protein
LASNEDINKELLSRTYQQLSEEFKEKIVRAVELVPMMYNRLTIVDKKSHSEAIRKIIDYHRQVSGFSSRNIKQYGMGRSTVIIFRTDSAKKIIIMQMIQEKTSAINQDVISVVDADGSELPTSNKH